MTKTKTIIIETVGWMGTVLIVSAYFLVSNGYVGGDSSVYQLMNLSGAVFLGISLLVKKAWPALTLQIIWSVIAISALVTIFVI